MKEDKSNLPVKTKINLIGIGVNDSSKRKVSDKDLRTTREEYPIYSNIRHPWKFQEFFFTVYSRAQAYIKAIAFKKKFNAYIRIYLILFNLVKNWYLDQLKAILKNILAKSYKITLSSL